MKKKASVKAAPKKRPGRPSKAPEERLEQFSIRLPPKLKFGLDLLANHQGRSLSQAVEWSVRVALNSWQIAGENVLGDVLDGIYAEPNQAMRMLAAYKVDPFLIEVEDRSTASLVLNSREVMLIEEELLQRNLEIVNRHRGDKSASDPLLAENRERHSRALAAYEAIVVARWDELRERAVELSNLGKFLPGQSVLELLGHQVTRPRTHTVLLEVAAKL